MSISSKLPPDIERPVLGYSSGLSVVIPTNDHPDELQRLLDNVAAQTRRPDEVIVVDGGATAAAGRVRVPDSFCVRMARVWPPGLARQQNVGARMVRPSSDLVAFIDDDMVLEPDALEAMLRFWRRAPADIGGAAFNLTNNTEPPKAVWAKALFGMDGARRGRLLRSGYQTKIGSVRELAAVEWLYGGATVWRRSLLEGEPFDEWFEGPGYLYELDFSLRVRRQFRLMVVAEARANEVPAPTRQWDDARLGRWQVLNRLYVVAKHRHHGEVSLGRCCLALGCQFMVNLGRGVMDGDRRYLTRAWGNWRGWQEAWPLLSGGHRRPSGAHAHGGA